MIKRGFLLYIVQQRPSFCYTRKYFTYIVAASARCLACSSMENLIIIVLGIYSFTNSNCPTNSSKILAWANNSSLVADASWAVAALL